MKNLKTIYLVFLLFTILDANLKVKIESKAKKARRMEKVPQLKTIKKKKLMARVLKMYKQGEANFRKLNLKLKKDPNYIEKQSRKLLFDDMTGGEAIGLLGGLGGIYQYSQGNSEYEKNLGNLQQQTKYQNMQLMMKLNQRRNLVLQMDGFIKEMEDRIEDLGDQVSGKIQQYESAVHS